MPQSDCACCLAIVPAWTLIWVSRRVATITDSDSGTRMKAMIVDDEPPARRELRRMLAEFPWIEIVGEAGNVEEAASKCEALSPELLFLDIQMPGGSGFDLLTRLDYVPQVVFTTAHDEHAVRAFEINALDYVLKPIDPERLAAAVSRVKVAPAVPKPGAALEQIFIKDGPGAGSYLCAKCASLPPRATTCDFRGETNSRYSAALCSDSSNASTRSAFFGPTVARSSTWTSSRAWSPAWRAACTCSCVMVPKWRSPGARHGCSECEQTFDRRRDSGTERTAWAGRRPPRPRSIRSARSGRAQSCAAAARPPLR